MDRPERRTPARRLTLAAVAGLLVALAVAGMIRSAGAGGPATDAERAEAVAASLRCPTCQGLSVADSSSPLAQSMRRIVEEQVADGRSEEQVRQFFVDRYGDWVLLAPRSEGAGWLVWAVPVLAVVAGLLVVAGLVRRRRPSQAARWVLVAGTLAAALGVLVAVNLDERQEGELATGNIPAAEDPAPAATGGAVEQGASAAEERLLQMQAAVDEDPDDVAARLALASTAFEAGRPDLVRAQADAVLRAQPDNVDALMLRGLAAEGEQDPAARAALRRFTRLAPAGHPALPLVRGLLEGGR